MKLYGYWRSSTSYRIRIALNLKHLDYDYLAVDLKEGAQKAPDYLAINAHGTVPLLDTGELHLTQSLAILDWLEEAHPDPAFLPKTDRALCRDLYYAVATEIHALNNLPVLKRLGTCFGADAQTIEDWYGHWVSRTFAPVEARLRAHDWKGAPLPFGCPTVFEIVLIPQIYNARRFNTDMSKFPLLERIDAHCQTLDTFINAQPDQQPDAPQGTDS